jgi:hypothetical protein
VAGDGRQRGAEFRRRLGLVRGGERDQEPVVDLGVEDGDADAVGVAPAESVPMAPDPPDLGLAVNRRVSRTREIDPGSAVQVVPRQALALLVPGGPARTVGTYSSSWIRPSKVRLLIMSSATSG